jgi:RNA polymerase sigma-70 factor (ECF subfamily)
VPQHGLLRMSRLDPTVQAELVALLPRLRRFARGLAGAPDQADDLVQAACERAIARIHQWTPGTRLDSWMFRIVQTIWLDQTRAQKVRTGEGRIDADSPLVEAELAVDGARDIEAQITYDAVRRCMARLPDEQRAVLLLVCVDGRSYNEAADALAIPIGTVMSRLSRARAALSRMLEGGPVEASGQVARLPANGP